MLVTEVGREELEQALKACKTLLLFQATDTPLLLEATEDHLVLHATGGGAAVCAKVAGKVEEEGSIAVDLNHLLSLHLTGKSTSFKGSKNQIQIRSGRGTYKISSSTSKVEKVAIPEPTEKTVEIQAALLRSAIKAIWFKHDDSGTGDIRIVFGKGQLRTETADEFRGVVYRKEMKSWEKHPLSKAILPKKSADAILSAFNPEHTLYLETTPSALRMYSDECYVAIPMVLDSELPNVSLMLKEQMAQLTKVAKFQLGAVDLLRMSKSAMSVLDKKDSEKLAAAQVHLSAKQGKFELRTEGDIGSFQTQVSYAAFEGEEVAFKVLAKNFSDLVGLAKSSGQDLAVEVWGKALVMLRNVQGDYRSTYAFSQTN